MQHENALNTLRNAGLLLAKRVGMDYAIKNRFVSVWVYGEDEVRALANGLKRITEQFPTEKETSLLIPILNQIQETVKDLDEESATA